MAVLGPLATSPEPHTYDLCENHAMSLTVPVGWQIVRLQTTYEPAPPSSDDLLALVDAVRAAARSEGAARRPQTHPPHNERTAASPLGGADEEEPSYATVTQLRPHSLTETSQHGSNTPAPSRDSTSESRPAGLRPRSAAEHVASELGPFAQPRPDLPAEE